MAKGIFLMFLLSLLMVIGAIGVLGATVTITKPSTGDYIKGTASIVNFTLTYDADQDNVTNMTLEYRKTGDTTYNLSSINETEAQGNYSGWFTFSFNTRAAGFNDTETYEFRVRAFNVTPTTTALATATVTGVKVDNTVPVCTKTSSQVSDGRYNQVPAQTWAWSAVNSTVCLLQFGNDLYSSAITLNNWVLGGSKGTETCSFNGKLPLSLAGKTLTMKTFDGLNSTSCTALTGIKIKERDAADENLAAVTQEGAQTIQSAAGGGGKTNIMTIIVIVAVILVIANWGKIKKSFK